jgi:antitoxin HicB
MEMKGGAVMARNHRHIGSRFASWLGEAEIREEVTDAAIMAVIARQLADEMKKQKITKKPMAALMKTSPAQLDRLLDPDNGSATIESLQCAARIIGREWRLQLV